MTLKRRRSSSVSGRETKRPTLSTAHSKIPAPPPLPVSRSKRVDIKLKVSGAKDIISGRKRLVDEWRLVPKFDHHTEESNQFAMLTVLARALTQKEAIDIIEEMYDVSSDEGSSSQASATPTGANILPSIRSKPDYRPFVLLGEGGEGSAHAFTHFEDKAKTFVVKTICRQERKNLFDDNYKPHEMTVFDDLKSRKVRHENIVACLGSETRCPDFGNDSIFLSWCFGGDVHSLYEEHHNAEKAFPEHMAWHILSQLLAGLAFLHEGHGTSHQGVWNPISHGDIKLANLFIEYPVNAAAVDPSKPFTLKIADFGHARTFDRRAGEIELDRYYIYGTADFAPPEDRIRTVKADVWAAGAVMHALCTGDIPIDMRRSTMDARGIKQKRKSLDDEWIRRLPRVPYNLTVKPQDRTPLHEEALGVMKYQATYTTALQWVMGNLLIKSYRLRPGSVDALNAVEWAKWALEMEGMTGRSWTCYMWHVSS